MTYYTNYLEHHGIKGQKWGIRRFQEEDGSLTAEGRSRYSVGKERYKRGKELSKDLDKAKDKEVARLTKQSKKYQDNEKEVKRLSEKYGLDPDTGEEDNFVSREHSREDIKRAKDRLWDLSEKRESMNEEISEKALNNAKKYIQQQYGDTALSDIDFYKSTKSKMVRGLFIGLGSVLLAKAFYNYHSNAAYARKYRNSMPNFQ